jgi:GT2 family glycosyltransferase/glycosyltransferase involved in cell wall biosynthesis
MIDVVVPVYGQVDLALRCIKSVLASKNRVPFQLIVIDDGSPDPKVFRALKAYAATRGITLLRNPKNLGFPETCNRAFALNPTHDVVLLNSDAVVFGDWLDRLAEVAASDSTIGTVTPMSNEASIASYPGEAEQGNASLEISKIELDQLAAAHHRGSWVAAPTGVGFCMLFTRACLNDVGDFDSKAYGRGYGEENDFCQRAIRRGYVNAITPGVFVQHDGGRSFGDSKPERMARAIKVVEQQNPGYLASVGAYMKHDPLAAFRAEIDRARIRRRTGGGAVLMVTHTWGGGTARHVQELTQRLEAAGTAVLFCQPTVNGDQTFTISDPKTPHTPNLVAHAVSDPPGDFATQLHALGVGRVHIHNLAGFTNSMARYLTAALAGSTIPYDITAHDYQHWCPQITLVGVTGQYCGEPDLPSCQRCVNHLGSPFGKVDVWEWRHGYEALLRGARSVFTPSHDAAQRINRHVPGLVVQVRPHDAITLSGRTIPTRRSPKRVRVGIIGAISENKGRKRLEDLATYAQAQQLPITFTVVGYADNQHTLDSLSNVRITGRYDDSDLDAILVRERLDVIFFPAVWPETYSFTLTAAVRTGLPIVAFDIGAIAERLRAHGLGTMLTLESVWDLKEVTTHLLGAARGKRTEVAKVQTLPYANIHTDYYGLPVTAKTTRAKR